MAKERIYPVGVQTFSDIIEEGMIYVDKTALIYNMAKKYKYVFLSRPRRFGKGCLPRLLPVRAEFLSGILESLYFIL